VEPEEWEKGARRKNKYAPSWQDKLYISDVQVAQ